MKKLRNHIAVLFILLHFFAKGQEHIELQTRQRLDSPCRCAWDLVKKPWEYVHSSAQFYFNGNQGIYEVMSYMELEDIDLTKL